MKRIMLLSIVLFVFASCGGGEPGADVEVAVPVSVEEMVLGPMEEFVTATGTVKASMEVTITAETGGEYILQDNPETGRPFALGDIVKKGTRIIRLFNPEPRLPEPSFHDPVARTELVADVRFHAHDEVVAELLGEPCDLAVEVVGVVAGVEGEDPLRRIGELGARAPSQLHLIRTAPGRVEHDLHVDRRPLARIVVDGRQVDSALLDRELRPERDSRCGRDRREVGGQAPTVHSRRGDRADVQRTVLEMEVDSEVGVAPDRDHDLGDRPRHR